MRYALLPLPSGVSRHSPYVRAFREGVLERISGQGGLTSITPYTISIALTMNPICIMGKAVDVIVQYDVALWALFSVISSTCNESGAHSDLRR